MELPKWNGFGDPSLLYSTDVKLIMKALEAYQPADMDEALDMRRIYRGVKEMQYWQAGWTSRNLVLLRDDGERRFAARLKELDSLKGDVEIDQDRWTEENEVA